MSPITPSAALEELVTGRDLDEQTAHALMRTLMAGELDPVVVAALLVALRTKGETPDEVAGFVRGMIDAATPLEVAPSVRERAVDTCGTGGDGAGTINVSTVAALVVAAAGVPVVKHGNRAASSLSGSADLLEAWGVAIDLGPEAAARVLDQVGITFLFARRYHPAMRHVAPVRTALRLRTVFNLLGPLSNPARVRRQVVGVPDLAIGRLVADALARLGHVRALVVHGGDGLDELTTTTTSHVWDVRNGSVVEEMFDPATLGIARATLDDLRGGDVALNRQFADDILAGTPSARAELVALNAGAALVVAEIEPDVAAGFRRAQELLRDGSARGVLERWVVASQRASVADANGGS